MQSHLRINSFALKMKIIVSLVISDNWEFPGIPFNKSEFGKWDLHLPSKQNGDYAIDHLSELMVTC